MSAPADYCSRAMELISTDRAADHGDFRHCHETVARYWAVLFGIPVTPHQVAHALALLKLARMQTGRLKPDDDIDLIGYAALGAALRHGEGS